MDQLTRGSIVVSPVDCSEDSTATSYLEGQNRGQPAKTGKSMSGIVSNLKDLERLDPCEPVDYCYSQLCCNTRSQVVGNESDARISLTTKLWSKCRDVTHSVCRALGLAIIPHALRSLSRHITGKGLHEPIKVAVRKNYTIAILRSLTHVLPISFALAEIVLNWNTYYVGLSPYNQAVYQLLAKIHEIMIQASLATVILAYIRHEIAFGDGLPLGALVSGLQISQFAYLWSMEFWGTIRSTSLRVTKKLRLLIVILTCFTVAILAGPSSAVLLIPRLDFWPGGSTDIWINATSDDIYPSLSVSLR